MKDTEQRSLLTIREIIEGLQEQIEIQNRIINSAVENIGCLIDIVTVRGCPADICAIAQKNTQTTER